MFFVFLRHLRHSLTSYEICTKTPSLSIIISINVCISSLDLYLRIINHHSHQEVDTYISSPHARGQNILMLIQRQLNQSQTKPDAELIRYISQRSSVCSNHGVIGNELHHQTFLSGHCMQGWNRSESKVKQNNQIRIRRWITIRRPLSVSSVTLGVIYLSQVDVDINILLELTTSRHWSLDTPFIVWT